MTTDRAQERLTDDAARLALHLMLKIALELRMGLQELADIRENDANVAL
jgi:hypothetical protein